MVRNLTSKTLLKGLKNYAAQNNLPFTDVQILIFADQSLSYMYCDSMKPKSKLAFKDILPYAYAMMGAESHADEFMDSSITAFALDMDCERKEVFAFIMAEPSGEIDIAIFRNADFKSKIKLEAHFDRMGIS